MKRVAALLLALGVSSSALASDWINIGSSKNTQISMDASSVAKHPKGVKAWMKYVFSDPQWDFDVHKYYSVGMELNVYNCTERTAGSQQFALYGDQAMQNPVNKGARSQQSVQMTDVVPGSVAEQELEAVCKIARGKLKAKL